MTLPISGAISLANIQTEFGGTNPISLNEYYAGGGLVPSGTSGTNGAVPSSGAISFWNFYGTTAAVPGDNWTYQSSLAQTGFGTTVIYAALWHNSKFMVVGGPGDKCATSPDGVTWTFVPGMQVSSGAVPYSIGANGSTYVVGASAGKVMTSTDNGVSWTLVNLTGTSWLSAAMYSVAYGNSTFVGVGSAAKCATSPDGLTWTYRPSLSTSGFLTSTKARSLVWANSKFLVVGDLNNAKLASSPDGITWTNLLGLSTAWTPASGKQATSIIWNGSKYLIAGTGGNCATSPDGITWANQPGLLASGFNLPGNALAWSGSRFIVLSTAGSLATSPDGITWVNQSSLKSTAWGTTAVGYGATFGNSKFLVVGSKDTGLTAGVIATSP